MNYKVIKLIYLYSDNGNYEDYASGRVIYGGRGLPNFPVRLLNEIFERTKLYLDKKFDLVVYDPCCGGGYSLTILGFFYSAIIKKLYGSDINKDMIFHAKKNVSLLTYEGLQTRKDELEALYHHYGKPSHNTAINSVEKLKNQLARSVQAEIFYADCTKKLPNINPDIIITDIPYGNLIQWKGDSSRPLELMLEQLANISQHKTILALSMDKKQKINTSAWISLEKHIVGKRKFEILTNHFEL